MSVYRAMPEDLLAGLAVELDAVRTRAAELAAAVPKPPRPADLTVEDLYAPGIDGPDVQVRIYRPAQAPSPAPALYWIHGGGMVMGNIEMNDDACAIMAHKLEIVVAAVEYGLAPEHPY